MFNQNKSEEECKKEFLETLSNVHPHQIPFLIELYKLRQEMKNDAEYQEALKHIDEMTLKSS